MIGLKRPVVRETTEYDYRTKKPFVIRLEIGGKLVKIKVKGSRSWYTVPVKQIWVMGAANEAVRVREEKQARREAKRREREVR